MAEPGHLNAIFIVVWVFQQIFLSLFINLDSWGTEKSLVYENMLDMSDKQSQSCHFVKDYFLNCKKRCVLKLKITKRILVKNFDLTISIVFTLVTLQ